jgi:GPH family glycoside/pentoside/hexuronide:cation symporter
MIFSRKQKLAYSLGSLGTALSLQVFVGYIQFLYIDIFGLSAGLIGAGWALYGLWNAVNDPLAGQWSDQTRTRWGRRIPWIVGLALPLAVCFAFLWLPPAGWLGSAGRVAPALCDGSAASFLRAECALFAVSSPLFLYFMGMVLVFDLLWTIVVLNWTALYPEMYPGESERAEVSAYRQVFGLIGALVGTAAPPLIVGLTWPGDKRLLMAVTFAAITGATLFISVWGAKEKPEFSENSLPLIPALKATFASRAFRWYVLGNLFNQFAFQMLTVTWPFYSKYVLQITAGQQSLFLAVVFVGAIPFLALWTWLVNRLGSRNALILSNLVFAVGVTPLLVVQQFGWALAAGGVMAVGLAGLLMIPDINLADVIDEDELATGVRREGMYFGMNGFLIRFAFTLQGLLTGAVLTATHYINPPDPNVFTPQPLSALWGLRGLMAFGPVVGSLLCAWAMWVYPLHSHTLAAVKTRVAELHARKAAPSA